LTCNLSKGFFFAIYLSHFFHFPPYAGYST
jgi:hypothetical protein